MNREKRASMAQQTLEILQHGIYRTPSGREVDISRDLDTAVDQTQLLRPLDFPAELALHPPTDAAPIKLEVTPETTLEAAQRLALAFPNEDLLCLNFASAKNPGGGFLSGSQAQEESLARSSGLYRCLLPRTEMYDHNRHLPTCLYSDHMIYSPHVPVFRDDSGQLLEQPYYISFLSAPAVNAGAVRRNEPEKTSLIQPTMQQRTARLLWLAAQRQHRVLILGAWGCGVFGNDPAMVADLFADELLTNGRFSGQFRHVVFAVYDRTESQDVLNAFRHRFAVHL